MFVSLRPWDLERCLVQFEKDGVIQTHEKTQRRHNGLSYSHSWASQQKVSQTLTHICPLKSIRDGPFPHV